MDFGCGAMNDIGVIAEAGFKQIDAVDSEPSVSDIAYEKVRAGIPVTFTKSSFKTFPFEADTYDFFNAQNSIPFIKPEDFHVVMRRIKNSIKQDGVFVGTFFGPEDEWSQEPSITINTRAALEKMFKNWTVIKFHEEKAMHPTASGKEKHWHVFTVIASR